jgi:DNA-binding protein HU-beta
MNKSEFIDMVAERAELSKSAATRVIDAIFDATSGAIAEAVNTAGRLSIPGFGKFTTKKRAARTGRNPRTGTQIEIPERTSVAFSAGKGFRDSVAGGGAGGGGARKTATKKGGTAKKAGGTATKAAAKKSGGGGAAAKKTASKTASTARKTDGAGGGGTATKTAAKKTGGTTARKTGGTGTAAKKTR